MQTIAFPKKLFPTVLFPVPLFPGGSETPPPLDVVDAWTLPARHFRWTIPMSQTQAIAILHMRTPEEIRFIVDFTAPLQGDTLASAAVTESTNTLAITDVAVNASPVMVDGLTIETGCGVEMTIACLSATPGTTYRSQVEVVTTSGNTLAPICKLRVDT